MRLVLLLISYFVKLLGRAEAGICKPLFNKMLCIGLVYIFSFALIIRSVSALFLVFADNSLVCLNAVGGKAFEHNAYCAVNLALIIGVLNSNIKNAV